ncbi:MAG: tRNA lysidine(34) synthetase TilS [Elusimicrobia bacterium]|nr:tRNA lysidine(34) synthetase TilS [Elusimicrobiota bacterium]
MPTAKSAMSRLASFCRNEALLSPGDRVLAAVSGGADSVCLAHWLAAQKSKGRIRGLTLVHFHHGLREAADGDAESVRRLARSLSLECLVERLDVRARASKERRSLEDAGRALRYRALSRLCRRAGFTKAALGHHLDDQCETFLLHLLRGTSADGLLGIPSRRPLEGCRALVVRPLLGITRAEALAYCRGFGLRWREDESNRDTAFTRNWVRRKVLPLLETRSPRIREHLAAISADLRGRIGESVSDIRNFRKFQAIELPKVPNV